VVCCSADLSKVDGIGYEARCGSLGRWISEVHGSDAVTQPVCNAPHACSGRFVPAGNVLGQLHRQCVVDRKAITLANVAPKIFART
jgi:hypothetical protein